jgi:predicted amidophosphoribosyltransferase
MVVLPHWAASLLFLLAATPFLARVRRAWRRRRRLRDHLCLLCGYDLRASESLCPECGTAIAKAC